MARSKLKTRRRRPLRHDSQSERRADAEHMPAPAPGLARVKLTMQDTESGEVRIFIDSSEDFGAGESDPTPAEILGSVALKAVTDAITAAGADATITAPEEGEATTP